MEWVKTQMLWLLNNPLLAPGKIPFPSFTHIPVHVCSSLCKWCSLQPTPRPLCSSVTVFFSLLWCIYTEDLPSRKFNMSSVWQLWLWPLTYEMYMNHNIGTHSDVRSQTPTGAYKLIIINTSLCLAMCVCVRSDVWTASHHLFV